VLAAIELDAIAKSLLCIVSEQRCLKTAKSEMRLRYLIRISELRDYLNSRKVCEM
jgi:hypothetical protein